MTRARLLVYAVLLAGLLAAGCVQTPAQADIAAQKADAIALVKQDPIVYKLTKFASAFNDPALRKILSDDQAKITYDLDFEAVTWGENRFKVVIKDSLGGKENQADLGVVVDLKEQRVIEYSKDLAPGSAFMDAVSKFLLAPDEYKAKSILDTTAKFSPIDSCEQWGPERDMCYGYLAIVKNNPYICDEVSAFDSKFACVAAVVKNPDRCNAVLSQNQAACKILAITRTEQCLAYDPVKHDNEPASLQDQCLVSLPEKATAFGPSLCGMISDLGDQVRCLHSVAFNHADNAVCDKLDGMNRKVCRALALRDPKYCKLPDDSYDSGCIILLAKRAKDEKFCGVLPSGDTCFKEVAIAKQDKALCDKISTQSPDDRKGCYTFTSDWKPSKNIKGYIPFTALLPSGIGK